LEIIFKHRGYFMILDINKNYKITSDSRQLIVNKKVIVVDDEGIKKDKLVAIAYFRTLEGVCNYLMDRELRLSKGQTAKEIINDLREFKDVLLAAINSLKENPN
jgi:hypothetical protein